MTPHPTNAFPLGRTCMLPWLAEERPVPGAKYRLRMVAVLVDVSTERIIPDEWGIDWLNPSEPLSKIERVVVVLVSPRNRT